VRWIEQLHDRFIVERRSKILADLLAPRVSPFAEVLDVGCGDGRVAREIERRRPDTRFRGFDVLPRPDCRIAVQMFDGSTIPSPDRAVDDVLFVDVLHHAADPAKLLAEGARVARRAILIKDHLLEGRFAGMTLRFMDRVGNERHGVALPYNYWSRGTWLAHISARKLRVESWDEVLRLYPVPADWIFGRSLHFVARLSVERS
jgi:SAM-dependent methyltransferase